MFKCCLNQIFYSCNILLLFFQLPSSTPPAFVEFYKDGTALAVEDSDGNMEVINGETLLIYNITNENEGEYR